MPNKPHVRKFRHHLFAMGTYYVDYGPGGFGTFTTLAAARRAVAILIKNPEFAQ